MPIQPSCSSWHRMSSAPTTARSNLPKRRLTKTAPLTNSRYPAPFTPLSNNSHERRLGPFVSVHHGLPGRGSRSGAIGRFGTENGSSVIGAGPSGLQVAVYDRGRYKPTIVAGPHVSVKASSIERAGAPDWRTLRHSPVSVERLAVSQARTCARPQHSAPEQSPCLSRAHRRIVARRHHQRWGYGSRTLEAFNWPMGGRGMDGALYTPAGQIANKGRSRVSSQLGGP